MSVAVMPSMRAVDQRQGSFRPQFLERRSKLRFPVELRVRYQALGKRLHVAGFGRVVNISSGGLLIASGDKIAKGARMELSVEWPSLLDGHIRLRLVAVGRVVRQENTAFAIAFIKYQFHTAKRTVIPVRVAS